MHAHMDVGTLISDHRYKLTAQCTFAHYCYSSHEWRTNYDIFHLWGTSNSEKLRMQNFNTSKLNLEKNIHGAY